MTGGFTKVQDDPPFPMYILKTGIRVNQVFLLYVFDELIEFHEKKCSQNGLDPWIPSIEDRFANCYAMEPTVIAWRLSGGGGVKSTRKSTVYSCTMRGESWTITFPKEPA